MLEIKNSDLVEDLLLKFSLCPQNKQTELFEEYVNILPTYLINQVKNLLIDKHPFISNELNEILKKTTLSNKIEFEDKSCNELENNINLSLLFIYFSLIFKSLIMTLSSIIFRVFRSFIDFFNSEFSKYNFWYSSSFSEELK